jgi:hypothetical protein
MKQSSEQELLDFLREIDDRLAKEKYDKKIQLYILGGAAAVIAEPEWKERSVEILKGKLKHLQVRALSKEDLILSKLGRYNDRDRDDIEFLFETRKIDAKKLIEYYEAARLYYIGNLEILDNTVNSVLSEHYGLTSEKISRMMQGARLKAAVSTGREEAKKAGSSKLSQAQITEAIRKERGRKRD